MWLIVGLGNPGKQYQYTRHNIGFMAADILADHYGLSYSDKTKFNADIASGNVGSDKLLLCKPNSFMNLSGKPVGALVNYYKIQTERIIVIHDDIDLNFNTIKCKTGGGSGGHNGIKSIDEAIGQDYHRIRIGIGRPQNHNIAAADFVLAQFSEEEKSAILVKLKLLSDNIELLINDDVEKFKSAIR